MSNKQNDGHIEHLVEMIDEMAGVAEPYGLFEPFIWKDKLGDSLWHCDIRSTCGIVWGGKGETLTEAVTECYKKGKFL